MNTMKQMIIMVSSGLFGAIFAGSILFVTTAYQSPFDASFGWYANELPVITFVMITGLLAGMIVALFTIVLSKILRQSGL